MKSALGNALRGLGRLLPLGLWLLLGLDAPAADAPPVPRNVVALSRQLRVDLLWEGDPVPLHYEVRRAQKADGPYEPLTAPMTNVNINAWSDFIGQPGGEYYYEVRSVRPVVNGPAAATSAWSAPCHAHPLPLDAGRLPTEVEEAGFRYFHQYAHPGSGLARMGTHLTPNVCASGGTGFGMFNLAAGVERGFITRAQAVDRALAELRFLATRTQRYHGAFPHMIDGFTGQCIPFTDRDDGADLVETAFLMEGVLFWREYFSGKDAKETEIRKLANDLWHDVDWTWFAHEENGTAFLDWHWSPRYGWFPHDRIIGFNEAQITYILALASPTHPIQPRTYWQGWQPDYYGKSRTRFGVWLQLGQDDLGPPLFWTQYSYLGFDPRRISFQGRSYFAQFEDMCRVATLYADSRSNQFKGYGQFWGWTAGYGPDGYKVYEPGTNDDGTINPSAALGCMPYAPKDSRDFLVALYTQYGRQFWGPFGFYDAFNLSRHWSANEYLADDVGPIAPMIENDRSAMGWKYFMRAPELAAALRILSSPPSK